MITGWDIGGANIKGARVEQGSARSTAMRTFAIQETPDALPSTLRTLAALLGTAPREPMAVTMTAELSQLFRTKREGVEFVASAVRRAFPEHQIGFYCTAGSFLDYDDVMAHYMTIAAANWHATAAILIDSWRDPVLIDIGTTTTDIIPIADGRVAARGLTDPERLASGELLYLGAVRTPVEAIVHEVPLAGTMAGVSAESFALAGDVYLWRRELAAADYGAPTPDGRPTTIEFVRERLARVVCADREMLGDPEVSAIADHVAAVQSSRTAHALERVLARHPSISIAVTAGVGAFIAERAARAAGLRAVSLGERLGAAAARVAPAAAVALLLERKLAP